MRTVMRFPRELVPELWIALVAAAVLLLIAERLAQHPRLVKHGHVLISCAVLAGILAFLGATIAWLLDVF